MGREDNIRVFQDTERLCKENPKLREAILKSIKKQKMISELDSLLELEKTIYQDPTEIVVSKKRSLEAASAYSLNRVFAANLADQELLSIHEKRLRRILDVALMNENEVVILGAFGCGAFENKPEIVARAAKNVIQEYRYAFVTIEFAIYCNPWDTANYKVFNEILEEI